MGVLLALAGLVGLMFGAINLVRPLGWLRIVNRRQAGIVLACSLAVMLVGAALIPGEDAEDTTAAPAPTSTTATAGVASTSTTTVDPSPTTRLTTTSLDTTTTTGRSPTTEVGQTTTSSSGEALPLDLLITVPVELETPSGYDRDLFPHWTDTDGDGCDTRDEVLIRDAVGTPDISGSCTVGAGLWYSPYDAVWLTNASQIKVDHVVIKS